MLFTVRLLHHIRQQATRQQAEPFPHLSIFYVTNFDGIFHRLFAIRLTLKSATVLYYTI